MSAEGAVYCYRCSHDIRGDLGRQDSCPSCGFDTRVCRNCRHYERTANNECREEQAGRQVDKEKANFCEWFQPRLGSAQDAEGQPKQKLRSAAEELFGKKQESSGKATDPKSAAEALFRKKSQSGE
jgi:hypothetical protein